MADLRHPSTGVVSANDPVCADCVVFEETDASVDDIDGKIVQVRAEICNLVITVL